MKDFVVYGNEIEDYYFQKNPKKKDLNHLRLRGQSQRIYEDHEELEMRNMQNIMERRQVFMPFGCTVK